MRTSIFHSSKPTELRPQPLKKASLDKEEGGGIYVLWTHFSSVLLIYVFFFQMWSWHPMVEMKQRQSAICQSS